MSLRLIARDLYRLQQEVDRLEKKLVDCPLSQRDKVKQEWVRAKRERDQVRRLLDGRLDR